MTAIDGWTAKRFEGVRDAFAANFEQGREVGASFAAYHRGRKVVDVWGGIADPETGRPWQENTLELVYSSTKGVTAMCANKLAQEGRLDIDAPVVEYWPEFGAHGKERIPVSYLLSHRAGLAWTDTKMTPQEAFAWEPVIRALEQQAPSWEPGTKHGYHGVTYGYLVGEVVRRITGRSIGTYLREEIAGPLGADFWIGLPASEEPRVAKLQGSLTGGAENDPALRETLAQFIGPDTMLGKALGAPGGAFAGNPDIWNSRELHAAEVPAAGGVGDARGLARLYAACVGEVDGMRVLTAAQTKDAATRRTEGPDVVILDMDIQFGLGFMVPSSIMDFGGENGFGHFGAGGSMGWADPDAELAFGYVMNRMDIGLAGDTRSSSLVRACYDAIR
jgi:CubicO group peptidase (beta-lactamase class C family)